MEEPTSILYAVTTAKMGSSNGNAGH